MTNEFISVKNHLPNEGQRVYARYNTELGLQFAICDYVGGKFIDVVTGFPPCYSMGEAYVDKWISLSKIRKISPSGGLD